MHNCYTAGNVVLVLYLISDGYLGLDQQYDIPLKLVTPHDGAVSAVTDTTDEHYQESSHQQQSHHCKEDLHVAPQVTENVFGMFTYLRVNIKLLIHNMLANRVYQTTLSGYFSNNI